MRRIFVDDEPRIKEKETPGHAPSSVPCQLPLLDVRRRLRGMKRLTGNEVDVRHVPWAVGR